MTAELWLRDPCIHGKTTKECYGYVCTGCDGASYHDEGCQFSGKGREGIYPCQGGSEERLDPELLLFPYKGPDPRDINVQKVINVLRPL